MSVAMSSSSLPRTLTVAALQLNSANFDIEGNLKRAVPYVESAARDGAKLILLPEFYSSGYLAERVRQEMIVYCIRSVLNLELGLNILSGLHTDVSYAAFSLLRPLHCCRTYGGPLSA